MKSLYLLLFFLILFNFYGFSQKKEVNINTVNYYVKVPTNNTDFYFSVLNPNYSEDKEKQYIVNALYEAVKFADLQIGIGGYDQTYGSYILSDMKIKTTIDANLIEDFFPYIKVTQLVTTKYGDIITVKITKDAMASIWVKFNKKAFPDFNFELQDVSIDMVSTTNSSSNKKLSNVPWWFKKPPEVPGYIFAVGAYSQTSKITDLFSYADTTARAEIVQILKTKVSAEINDYMEDNYELTSFFNNKTSVANIGGIYIIRRFFDEKKKVAYSLAVLKL
ncbi:MAG: hypothetical protein A2086_03405 [Spirochaetes bacterium GWD1_27_9]|nr:MAG: hypothetical protein A2Z98_14745 [Spirochaetes bacterium GWB1_27_13]OHD24823.1 MAG: hypothetical protein A2Y34_08290 [Spirochaetes bacterium GWC1_27_15]OHD45222.1 MAG: hypothetical protein A2086_03405 [Spirochaetes bacterium GWD1_27_9]